MDHLKEAIALRVHNDIKSAFHGYIDDREGEFEVQKTAITETLIKVKPQLGGTRWFKVKISEMM